jgi:hypothetical protein
MKTFLEFTNSSTVCDLLDNVLLASMALECLGENERGLTSRNRKGKSLLSRWINYNCNEVKEGSDNDSGAARDDDTVFIERGTVVTCNISRGKEKGKTVPIPSFKFSRRSITPNFG